VGKLNANRWSAILGGIATAIFGVFGSTLLPTVEKANGKRQLTGSSRSI